MTGWRQAVFVRQRRIDVIQRALSKILDDESWSPATPRRLYIGSADASSRGWTMIVPELASFFLDRGGTLAPRLCRLASELRCPSYEIDVRDATATTLVEVDALGRMRISGSTRLLTGLEIASEAVGFGLLPVPDDVRDRIATLEAGPAMALADYLGALAGFPAWTRPGSIDSGPPRSKDRNHLTGRVPLVGTGLDDDAVAAGELVYEPPRIIELTRGRTRGRSREPTHGRAYVVAGITAQSTETREATVRTTPRGAPPAHDRTGTRPRSAARPRR
jgi:hypothetical protein